MKLKILLLTFLVSAFSWGQTILANYKFENNLTAETGVIGSPSLTASSSVSYFAGVTGQAASFASSGGKYFELLISTAGYNSIDISFSGRSSASGTSWVLTGDSSGGTTFSSITSLSCPNGSFSSLNNFLIGAAYDNKTSIRLRITATGSSTATMRIDELIIRGIPAITADWCNLTSPLSGTIQEGGNFNVYAQVYEPTVTEAAGLGTGVQGWIGYSTTPTNPNTWTNWVAATFNTQVGNNDELVADIGTTLPAGTYYYASRFRVSGGAYTYGGYNGGFWNGTTNISGTLTVTPRITWGNLQSPLNGDILLGNTFNVYGRVYASGVTLGAGAGSGIQAWIGYSSTNTDPSTWTNWVSMTYNTDYGNDDEFQANLGTQITAAGTYFYATRYQYNSFGYVYGGYNASGGGIWNGSSNVNGTLIVRAAEIDVQGNSVSIVDGDTTPSTADATDFGTIFLGNSQTASFTIANSGNYNLNLSGASPYVTISGANASDFSITTAPSPTITASGSTTFVVTFTPSAIGVRNATLTINNNDPNEGVYDFAIRGTGTASSSSDIVAVASSESTTISSMINDAAPLTSTTGVQVWQFTVRDGGGTADADNLPTILTGFTLAQAAGGNQVGTWSDAIQTVALFDGSTFIATGTVTANQIQFIGLNVSVADNTNKTLSLRLSLKCPLGADAFDGEDFMFSLSNANTTFSSAGSQKSAFVAQTSTNDLNAIAVVATKLAFTVQPSTTGVNATMISVTVKATDNCGNVDTDFTGSITLTSTGTMSGASITVSAVNGVATFSGMIHTVVGTGFSFTASAFGVTSISSIPFNILDITTLYPGDLAILAVNTAAESIGSADEISFVCFKDLLPGTTIYLTDNGYERVTAGLWGDTEGIITLTRTTTTLTKGTIITIHTTDGGVNAGSDFTVYTCGSVDANWTKGVASPATYFFDLNKDDQVWITQGGTWTDPPGSHNMTYTGGNVLYGWTDIPWKTAPGYADTKGSTVFPQRECFTTDVANPETGFSQVKFNDPDAVDFSSTTRTRLDWIALINSPANWNYYTSDSNYDSGGYNYSGNATCPAMTIVTGGGQAGLWTGKKDTNWFDCSNWDTLIVPDETVNVLVDDNTYNNQAKIDITAPFASYYNNLAKTKNLTITGEKVELVGNANNILEVHGNLLIDAPAGALDMDDSSSATTDGTIHLYGNWTNNMGEAAFAEGNGTVHFDGTMDQIISNVTPEGTEKFYDVVMNNNFTTSVSNDLIATGNLLVKPGKTVTVTANDFIEVNKNLTTTGATFTVNDDGSLIQLDDTGVNTGNITYNRTTTGATLDYVYWSSPVDVVNTPSSGYIYRWDPVASNPNATQGYWLSALNTPMLKGKGYIMRGIFNSSFTGIARNGVASIAIRRGDDLSANNDDDDWNLVGNPYPSAISVSEFLNANDDPLTGTDGTIYVWRHNLPLSASNPDPFYENFQLNYDINSYVSVNALGSNPDGYGDYIPAGQGFFVNMIDGSAIADNTNFVVFNNSMRARSATYTNSNFYRTTNSSNTLSNNTIEKHRIWLDIKNSNNNSVTTLIGYTTNATNDYETKYDAIPYASNTFNIYSLINSEKYLIQGRALPFDDNDQVPLGFLVPSAGIYTIGINKVDGLFATTNQDIYLHDLDLGIYHDLRVAPYSFTATQGYNGTRFVLVYKTTALSSDEFSELNNQVFVSTNDVLTVNSTKETIDNVEVYNVLGQLLYQGKELNKTSFPISKIEKQNQVLLLTIQLTTGEKITKKVLY